MSDNQPSPQQPGQPPAEPVNHYGFEPRNGLGIAAISLAAVGVLFGLVPLTGFIAFGLGVVALIFALVNLGRIKRQRSTLKKTTWAGGILGLGAVALGVWGMVIVFTAVDDLGRDLDAIGEDFEDSAPVEPGEPVPADEAPLEEEAVVDDSDTSPTPTTPKAKPKPASTVEILECGLDASMSSSGDPWPLLKAKVTNNTKAASDISVTVDFLDKDNNRVGEGYLYAETVGAGHAATVDGSGDFTDDVGDAFTCKVRSAIVE